eukprot:gnl/MRDRNA2_/MRDRNA2_34106_c0_seq1.p2 gnl/MRDRNA2_/MRDRNA2_34106_c0~~gnl/MRDRNA2_/MRDRNA2_34106_c0_seq1.p2  ORF type:complete len:131 (+),score=25.57 gnl/MRDRNA2_/MRDRNA2_34106_c0_seq1:652-1044(+)
MRQYKSLDQGGTLLGLAEEELEWQVTRFAGEMRVALSGLKGETGFVLTSQLVGYMHNALALMVADATFQLCGWSVSLMRVITFLRDSREEIVAAAYAERVSRGENQIPQAREDEGEEREESRRTPTERQR